MKQKRVSLEGPPSLDSGVRALPALCPSVNQGACGCPSSQSVPQCLTGGCNGSRADDSDQID